MPIKEEEKLHGKVEVGAAPYIEMFEAWTHEAETTSAIRILIIESSIPMPIFDGTQ